MDAPTQERSGCLMALYVLFGVGAVLMVGGAIALSFFLRTPEGREMWAAVQRGATWATESQQAPGASSQEISAHVVSLNQFISSPVGHSDNVTSTHVPPSPGVLSQQAPVAAKQSMQSPLSV